LSKPDILKGGEEKDVDTPFGKVIYSCTLLHWWVSSPDRVKPKTI